MEYEIRRTLRHMIYLLLLILWFTLWYIVFALLNGLFDISLWSDVLKQAYTITSFTTGLGYFMYRLLT